MAPESATQAREVTQDAVVGEQPPMLLERVRVLHARFAGGCVADVGKEGARADFVGTGDERVAAIRGHRLAVDRRRTVLAESSQPDPIRLALAL